jgi:hypothetical protein
VEQRGDLVGSSPFLILHNPDEIQSYSGSSQKLERTLSSSFQEWELAATYCTFLLIWERVLSVVSGLTVIPFSTCLQKTRPRISNTCGDLNRLPCLREPTLCRGRSRQCNYLGFQKQFPSVTEETSSRISTTFTYATKNNL